MPSRPTLATLVLTLFVLGPLASPAGAQMAADFSGTWSTDHGNLVIVQNGVRVEGTYTGGRLDGTVDGERLVFRYRDSSGSGRGTFTMSEDRRSFQGRWRAGGDADWSEWNGSRAVAPPQIGPFEGLWQTTFGRLRLFDRGGVVTGTYSYTPGSTVEGKIDDEGVLRFHYVEPDTRGEGWFRISPDRKRIEGRWRAEGDPEWSEWGGYRVEPVASRTYVVVLEAYWEEHLAEREYAFGNMMRSYLARFPDVQVRHRRFGSADELVRQAGELAFLAEPVILLVASHGSPEGLEVGGKTIGSDTLARLLKSAPSVFLLHFSSCSVMAGPTADRVREALPADRRIDISGYAVDVEWGASALLEFLYLEMILDRRYEPAQAAEIVRRELSFAGDEATPDSPVEPVHFRFSGGR